MIDGGDVDHEDDDVVCGGMMVVIEFFYMWFCINAEVKKDWSRDMREDVSKLAEAKLVAVQT